MRSFKFASAGFCFRLRAGFFLLLQARFGGGFTRLFLFGKSYKSKDNGNGNTGSGRGAEKKAYVVEFLYSKGIKIDAETLDKLIEAAVLNLPDYFTISGIPADTDSNKE